jgi:hypothetical protein
MRTLRLLAGLAAAAVVGAAGPAFAGGGAGMTVTASMPGQNGLLPFGSPHTVQVQVTDSTLGEATLEHVTVTITVAGAPAPVVCDRGPNGTVLLVPGLTVDCSTRIIAGAGAQTIIVQAVGVVAGGDSKLVRTVVVTYQGSVPTPVPTPVPAPIPSSPRTEAVRPSPVPTLRTVAPSSAASASTCALSATSTVNGAGCTPSSMPSTACMPGSSPGAGSVSAGGGCGPELPSASPAAGCAGGVWPSAPGSADCAKASGRGMLALTGAQFMLWSAFAVAAVVSGVVLMLRHRRFVR